MPIIALPLQQIAAKKSFWCCPRTGPYFISFREGLPPRDSERTAFQDRSASQTKQGFSVSKIRGAPQLNDPTEWALPHLTLRRFTPPPTSTRFPPLCSFCMGMPTLVGWRCSLYRTPFSLRVSLWPSLPHSVSSFLSHVCIGARARFTGKDTQNLPHKDIG